MKIAIVYFSGKNRTKMQEIAKGMAAGLSSQGHSVDLIDGKKDINTKLTMYEYIVVEAEAVNYWGGKIDNNIGKFLSSAGVVSGKKSCAVITPKGLRQLKTLKKLMDTMEHEGMFLKNSEIVASYKEAEKIGRTLA
ncbi:MAG: hypothetical protein R6V67_08035 [Spirochaetia bacterium]